MDNIINKYAEIDLKLKELQNLLMANLNEKGLEIEEVKPLKEFLEEVKNLEVSKMPDWYIG